MYMEQHPDQSGEDLDVTTREVLQVAGDIQEIRRRMGHLSYEQYLALDRHRLRDAAEVLKVVARRLVQDTLRRPERIPPPPRETWREGLLKPEHWVPGINAYSTDKLSKMFIVDDITVRVDGVDMWLPPPQLFLVNHMLVEPAALSSRLVSQRLHNSFGEPVGVAEAHRLLFNLWVKLGKDVMRQINGPDGQRYCLRSGLVVIDLREPPLPPDDFEVPAGIIAVDGDFFAEPAVEQTVPDDRESGLPAIEEIVSVLRKRAERRERAHQPHWEWGDVADIARLAGVDARIVALFIDRHRHVLRGGQFLPPELRTPQGGASRLMTEHYSPQFVAWAVDRLKAAYERYINRA